MDKVLPFLLHKSGVWTPFQSAQCYQSTQQFINAIRVRTAVDQFRHLPSSWLSNSLSTVATAEMQGEKAKKCLIYREKSLHNHKHFLQNHTTVKPSLYLFLVSIGSGEIH